MKPKKQLRKVKIDEAIKGTSTPVKKKVGRPKKQKLPEHSIPVELPQDPISGTSSSESISDHAPGGIPESSQQIEVEHDTTQEAKAVLETIFAIPAGLSRVKEVALYPEEVIALAPSFKGVYDKYILPYLQDAEHKELIIFLAAGSGIIMKKASVMMDGIRERNKAITKFNSENQTPQNGQWGIPTETATRAEARA